MQSGPLRKSYNQDQEFSSPFSHGRIDSSYQNLRVRLLSWPDEEQFGRMATIAGKAHAGASFDLELLDIDSLIVADAWKGGLGQIKEFGKLDFLITGCSRGLTHEIVRTRIGAAYIQQTTRHCDMGNFDVRRPASMSKPITEYNTKQLLAINMWATAVAVCRDAYDMLVEADFPYQDARTICPIGMETWIIVAYDVRSWLDMYAQRACQMFYPEFIQITKLMKEAVQEKAPWIADQAKIACERPQPDGTHKCTYQGAEIVEGWCDLPWAKEDNRVWKSAKFKK